MRLAPIRDAYLALWVRDFRFPLSANFSFSLATASLSAVVGWYSFGLTRSALALVAALAAPVTYSYACLFMLGTARAFRNAA